MPDFQADAPAALIRSFPFGAGFNQPIIDYYAETHPASSHLSRAPKPIGESLSDKLWLSSCCGLRHASMISYDLIRFFRQ
ncbi:hypothetical protein [Pseudomonas khavaziana]|uniref:Uncharacterized protein n=1 Tax=Pseudomonas khavaziana TaxID=2842351 RepID=A0ABZ2DF07_9PSED